MQKPRLLGRGAQRSSDAPGRWGDLSRWGPLNAVTAAAKSASTVDRQVEMEQIGWDIANFTTKQWASIAVVS